MEIFREIRTTIRRLGKSPTTSVAAVITMALGIGVATGAYSIIDGLALRGVTFENPDRLVALSRTNLSGPWRATSVPEHDFADWREQQQSFEDLMGFRTGSVNLREVAPERQSLPERYSGAWVTAGFLELLRVSPVLGRGFADADAEVGAAPVVLIGHGVWQQDFGAAPDIVGRTVLVNARPTTIIGVLPEDFRFPIRQDVWLPLILENLGLPRGEGRTLQVVGRLADGVSLTAASEEMSTIARRLGDAYPETNEGMGVQTSSYVDHIVESYLGGDGWLILTSTFAIPGLFVLLIACANVTNLLFGRAAARRHELAIRSALGSGRLRTVRQVLIEAGVLSLAGAALGIVLAAVAVRVFSVTMSAVEELPYWVAFEINGRVLAFVVAASVISAAAAGIAPALRAARSNPNEVLRDGGHGVTGFRLGWLSRSLAVVALALSCALAIAGVLSVRSTLTAQHHELSFDPARVLTARIGLVEGIYTDDDELDRLYAQILEDVTARPEVARAAIGTVVPVDTQLAPGSALYQRARETYEGWWEMPRARSAVVSPGYFATFGVDVLAGRDFGAADRAETPLVVIVNEDFASREWPGENPIGQHLNLWMGRKAEAADPEAGRAEVVGLVPNLQFSDFANQDDQQAIYLPLTQHPRRSTLVIARTHIQPTAFAETLRQTVQAIDPDLPLFFVRSMENVVSSTLVYHKFISATFAIFGSMALLLAVVGLYGVTLVSVMQRVPEMGVRIALGAEPRKLVRLVLMQGMQKTTIGLAFGLAMGWGLGKALESNLVGVRPEDPVTLTAVPLFLATVTLLAYLVPSVRVSRVDPAKVLRSA